MIRKEHMQIEDPFGWTNYDQSGELARLREIRDRITCNERQKNILFQTGFIPEVRFNTSVDEGCIKLEILALLANTQNEGIRTELRKTMGTIFDFVRRIRLPFDHRHVSIFRSLRIIISRVDYYSFYEKYFDFFVSIVGIQEQSPCVHAIKNEVVELLCIEAARDTRVERGLSTKKIMRMLISPSLNAIKLLDRLMKEKTKKYVKIGRLFRRIEGFSTRNKIRGLSCCVKWFRLTDSQDHKIMRQILTQLDAMTNTEPESLVLIGRMAENNIKVQLFCREISLMAKIIDSFDEENPEQMSPAFLYCIYALTSELEENRKAVARSKIIPAIFGQFKIRTGAGRFDAAFVLMVFFFKSMTKSICFLRSDLLEYPIVELLLSALGDEHPRTPEGLDEIFPDHDPGLINENILNVLINLVLEYGNYKQKFVSAGGVAKVMKFGAEFPHAVLHIFKNFLYDTNFNSKEVFINATSRSFFKDFFDLYRETGDLAILEGCFNLMRNLLCDDTLEHIIRSYTDLLDPIFYFLDVFSNRPVTENSMEEAVLLQIFYTIVNLSANTNRFKSLILKNIHLENMKRVSTTRNLCIAFIWIIINLSWREEGYEERVQILLDNGVREWLIGLQTRDPVLADKVGTALDNLR
jgi:armadillo repeat-containing protein 8